MKIGILSDSHDHSENVMKTVQVFRQRDVARIIHLGDYVNPASVKLFQGERLIGIFGNNDGDKYRLINAFSEIGGEIMGDFYAFEEGGLTFACYHGTEPQLKDALIESGKYDIVLSGHTHAPEIQTTGGTLALNPGTAHGFWRRATVMVFDTAHRLPEIIEL